MSKGKKTTKQSTNQTLDPYSRQQYEQQRDRTQGLLDGGYQGTWGATSLSDSEQRAGGLIDQYTGSYADGLNEARGLVNGASFTPGTLTPKDFSDFDADTYVNPYADDMISRMSNDVTQGAERARAGITADTLSSNAYGGSRHGVREALLDESTLDTIADQSAGIRFNTWNQGADRFYQDAGNDMNAQVYNNDQINRGAEFDLRRGGMLADFTGQERGFQDQDIARLMNYGATERAVADQQGAREYDDYWRRVQAQMGLLGSVPIAYDSTGQSTQTTNPGLLGTLGTVANGAAAVFGTGGLWPLQKAE